MAHWAVQASGWVGFGISTQGMRGADVFIGWVVDEDGFVSHLDRFAYEKALPPADGRQDYFDVELYTFATPEEAPTGGGVRTTRAAIALAAVAVVVCSLYLLARKGRLRPGGSRGHGRVDDQSHLLDSAAGGISLEEHD